MQALCAALIIAPAMAAHATTVDMGSYATDCSGTGVSHSGAASYDVCLESLTAAISAAKTALNGGSGTYTITVAAGTYNMGNETAWNHTSAKGVINVSSIWPTASGATLIFEGSTSGTVFITDNSLVTIWGTNVSNLEFENLTFERNAATVTQGTVATFSPGSGTTGYVEFTVPSGFPLPTTVWQEAADVNDGVSSGGTSINSGWMRAYSNATNPQLIGTSSTNAQIGWSAEPTLVSGSTYKITFSSGSKVLPDTYSGAVACLKMTGVAQAYYFNDLGGGTTGTNVGFNNVTWYDQARGVWRNIVSPYVTNSYILPRAAIGGQGFCMSTPDGGPQISQPGDAALNLNAQINNFYSDRTGDDTIAIFNDSNTTIGSGSYITNSTINSAFARNINLFYSCYVNVPMPQDPGPPSNANTVTNCWSADTSTTGYNYEVPFTGSTGTISDGLSASYYKGCVTDTSVTEQVESTGPCFANRKNTPPL